MTRGIFKCMPKCWRRALRICAVCYAACFARLDGTLILQQRRQISRSTALLTSFQAAVRVFMLCFVAGVRLLAPTCILKYFEVRMFMPNPKSDCSDEIEIVRAFACQNMFSNTAREGYYEVR